MNLPTPETNSSPIDLTGRKLGDYELFRRLGRGGMADVYLAKQSSLNRNVALKILKPELAKDHSYVQRFRQEAQAAANLIQANIVQIYEVGESEGFYFIAQEYIQGRNLSQYMARHGAVEPVMAINVLRQCAMALQKADELHVIHRDIKPENIMLSTKGEVKITDFGLARINNKASDQALTQIGVTMGTPLYMSPEQVEGRSLDHRSDIYSLGVTAYHMLAGKPPFDGDNALTIALQHVKDKPASITELRPDVPPELCDIIDRMMAKNQDDRPSHAKQLLKDLRKVKIDIDDDWEMIVEKLSTTETSSITSPSTWSQSKLAATRQLQAVMKGNVQSWWKTPRTILALATLSIVSLFGGWMLAMQTVPESLLNVEHVSSNAIPAMATANEQYVEAQLARYRYEPAVEEQFWLAVEKNFDPDDAPPGERKSTQLTIRNSKARLAEFYLTHNRPEESLSIFDEFVGYEELAEDFRVLGHAGKAIVYDGMQAAEFEGGVEEKMSKIRAAIGNVGTRFELLNKFMATRFQIVKNRLDEESVQPEDVQDSRRDSSLFNWLFRRFEPLARA